MENLFYVRNNGELYAQNAKIRGTIYADAGEIDGSLVTYGINAANISTGYLDAARIEAESLSTGKISGLYAYVQNVIADTVTANYIDAKSAILGNMKVYNTAGVSIGFTVPNNPGMLSVNGNIYCNQSLALGYGSGMQSGYQ